MAADQFVCLHREAPPKPRPGAPCNGCGICCAAETCALGRLVFRRVGGPCPALAWTPEAGRYVCGLVTGPADHLRWLPQGWRPGLTHLFARWIAAGTGCDSDAEVEESQ
jgi:hypothetical protein